MKKGSLNSYAQAGSILAVLAGLTFVVIELRQNNDIARTQMRNEMTLAQIENTRSFQTPEAIDIFVKGEDPNYQYSPEEERHTFLQIRATVRMWENMHYQHRLGLYDQEEIAANQLIWTNAFEQSQRFKDYWSNRRLEYSASFREEIDKIVGPLQ